MRAATKSPQSKSRLAPSAGIRWRKHPLIVTWVALPAHWPPSSTFLIRTPSCWAVGCPMWKCSTLLFLPNGAASCSPTASIPACCAPHTETLAESVAPPGYSGTSPGYRRNDRQLGADGSALPYVYLFAAVFMLRHEGGVEMRKGLDAFPGEDLVVAWHNTAKSEP